MNGVFKPEEYSDNPDLKWADISEEEYRIYFFPPPQEGMKNSTFRVDNPEAMAYKNPYSWQGGGSHRVVDVNGKVFYIPAGWIGLVWDNKPNSVRCNF